MTHPEKRTRKFGFLLMIAAVATLVWFSGCGGGGGGGGTPAPPALQDQPAPDATVDPGSEAGELNLHESGVPNLDLSGGIVAFSAPAGAPASGASGGPSASSFYIPAKAFDGSPSTWWAGQQNAGAWDIFYGFTTPVPLDSVYINFYGANYAPGSVTLSTSANGTVWTEIETKTLGDSKPLFTIAAPQPVLFIHIRMSGNPASTFPLIRDINWTPVTQNTGPYAFPGANDNFYFSSNAFDNNPSTWWAGKVDAGQWNFFYHDDTPQYLGMFTAQMYRDNYRPDSMKLYLSDDGQQWAEAGELTAGATASLFVGQSASYWLLQMIGTPPSGFPIIRDITWTLPAGASSGDSVNAHYKPANAFDGNPSTWWAGKPDVAEWNLFYGYEQPAAPGLITITYYAASHAPAQTELLISDDGRNWTSAGLFPAGPGPSLIASQAARYLRFRLTGAPQVGYPVIKNISMNLGGGTGTPTMTLVDGRGRPAASIVQGESVSMGLTGLVPGAMYDVEVSFPDGTSYILNLSADGDGEIPASAVLVYDAGLEIDPAEVGGSAPRIAGRVAALTAGESITVLVKQHSNGQAVTQFTLPYSGGGAEPLAYAANSRGYFRNSYVCSLSEDIYVAFRQFTTGEKVRVYIAEDRKTWRVGDYIPDATGVVEEFTLPGTGSYGGPQYLVWDNSGGQCAPNGNYDLIVERGVLDGYIDDGDIVDGHGPVGFVVQNAPASGDIIEQIASDKNYHYKNSFDPSETVYVYMNPKIRSRVYDLVTSGLGLVRKYVTNHKTTWNDGDSIPDATQGIEGDVVQYGCYNEGLVAVWPKPLTTGCYDIVIDANHNGVYDRGVDFLDNIDEYNQTTCGFKVESGGGTCTAQCVDAGDCEDGNDDTVDTCQLAGTCNAACRNDPVTCDLQVNKVNFIPGEPLVMTLTARNESSQDVKCGAEAALKNDMLNPNWNSFDQGMYIIIPAGTQVTRFMTKIIPGDWAGTDTSQGSDYAIYPVRENGSRWSKGDNFNIHVKWECAVACFDDSGCALGEFCHNANTCSAACSSTPCTQACYNDGDCDDGNSVTADTCDNMGTCGAVCNYVNICMSIACHSDIDCNDGIMNTMDTCLNPGSCDSSCLSTPCTPACSTDAACNDSNALTIDACNNAGTCAASCSNTSCPVACSSDAACDDGNSATLDVCVDAGTCSAACGNYSNQWIEMDHSASGTGISGSVTAQNENIEAFIDNNGKPVAIWKAYSDSNQPHAYLKRWSGAQWESLNGSATDTGLAMNNINLMGMGVTVDEANNPLIGWSNFESPYYYRCKALVWDGATWIEKGAGSATGDGIFGIAYGAGKPVFARDLSGRPIAAWVHSLNGHDNIYVKRWNGASWVEWNPGSASGYGISNTVSRDAYSKFGMAVNSQGYPVIAWAENIDAGTSNAHMDIYVKRWDGTAWVEVGTGSASGGGITSSPVYSYIMDLDLALDNQGNPIVVWEQHLSSGARGNIYVKHWDGIQWTELGAGSASGVGLSTQPVDARNVAIATDSAGHAFVVWQGYPSLSTMDVYGTYWSGSSWVSLGGSAGSGGISNSGMGTDPDVVVDSSGNFYVFWTHGGNYFGYGDVYVKRWVP